MLNHTSNKTTPDSVTLDNAIEVKYQLHKKLQKVPIQKPKYKVGDPVRIISVKIVFKKGYGGNCTEKIFKIVRVLNTRQPVVYVIAGLSGKNVEGIYYTEELNKVSYLSTHTLKVNEILNSRGKSKNKRL